MNCGFNFTINKILIILTTLIININYCKKKLKSFWFNEGEGGRGTKENRYILISNEEGERRWNFFNDFLFDLLRGENFKWLYNYFCFLYS